MAFILINEYTNSMSCNELFTKIVFIYKSNILKDEKKLIYEVELYLMTRL